VADCVFTVSVAVTAELPETGVDPLAEHVGASAAPDGPVTAQLRATLPVNPPLGVIVIAEVAFPPADGMLMFEPLSANIGVAGGPVTMT
jgi:hypothetical protein